MSFKYCPRCGDEFQSWAESCPDCDVPLGLEPPDPNAAPPAELPPAHELQAVFVGAPHQVRDPVDSLGAAGIPCRVDAFPPGGSGEEGAALGSFGTGTKVAVYVRAEDLPAVAGLDADWVRSTLATDSELDACPACAAPLAADASACPSCGLEFPAVDMCARCGATAPSATTD